MYSSYEYVSLCLVFDDLAISTQNNILFMLYIANKKLEKAQKPIFRAVIANELADTLTCTTPTIIMALIHLLMYEMSATLLP